MTNRSVSAPTPEPVLPPEKVRPHVALLRELAGKYIWWMSPEEALEFPARIAAQVMNTGEFEDLRKLSEALGDDGLRRVIGGAEAGWFNERSWHFWHYHLNLADIDQVPPLHLAAHAHEGIPDQL